MNRYAKCIKDSWTATVSVDALGKDLTMTLQVLVDTEVPQFCYLHSDNLESAVPEKQHS